MKFDCTRVRTTDLAERTRPVNWRRGSVVVMAEDGRCQGRQDPMIATCPLR